MNNILTKERLAQIVAEERANLLNTQEDECKAKKAGLGKDLGAIDSGLKVCDKKSGLVYTVVDVYHDEVSESDAKHERGATLKTPEGQTFFVSEKELKKNYKVE